ncbi:NADH-quinone oxidoreductase subunit A [Acidomonas methanolica]|uniref:NADH-quinone oxidoreductase subunit A n=1 Tax=Acidomonas methanolica NBRC 104435 TaxID=1231351 RepID=A0A023D2V6_ACIMT|nr:NADH-quinone oxidoreductase subunit A [Acidomonas methanolica]MBU2655007.1 NADH-quinone oxidoreductase subunit A [Acidomonas methanolica]TCS25678.1 NADH dehydrogenase subunit A [Acidomonas methanolica]GAJ28467.1 NADH-quinone oxidoreductase subunit A/NADH-ubiquinone/plastoquinone oxidoreductase subunit 3 [Acidomonas methanolica NBRC 104435]GBQ45201.1 NADH-quinone oxidoreductase subunit A [Acidomonas methanolica]GEK99489.1 NADH-quinone oxidoreductase subunit A [Acidomonas methanolica NBRC 104
MSVIIDFITTHILAIYIAFTAIFLTIVVALSSVLGPRRVGRAMGASMNLPCESGMLQTGTARLRLPVQYYLLAMFFVIFDVEGVFLYAWADVAVQAGWAAYITVVTFVVFLFVALAYLWRCGALDWGPKQRRPHPVAPVQAPDLSLVPSAPREV